jgi:hypothetical protein
LPVKETSGSKTLAASTNPLLEGTGLSSSSSVNQPQEDNSSVKSVSDGPSVCIDLAVDPLSEDGSSLSLTAMLADPDKSALLPQDGRIPCERPLSPHSSSQ